MNTQSPLVTITRDLLDNRPRKMTLDKVAAATGVSVSYLILLMKDGQQDFGAHRVTRIYEFLTGKQLEIK